MGWWVSSFQGRDETHSTRATAGKNSRPITDSILTPSGVASNLIRSWRCWHWSWLDTLSNQRRDRRVEIPARCGDHHQGGHPSEGAGAHRAKQDAARYCWRQTTCRVASKKGTCVHQKKARLRTLSELKPKPATPHKTPTLLEDVFLLQLVRDC